MEFATILQKFMTEENLTQEKFALRAGVKQSHVSAWLRGKFNPNYEMLRKICQAFPEISPAFWLGLENDF